MGARYTEGWPRREPVRGPGRMSRAEFEDRREALSRAPLFALLSKGHIRSLAKACGVTRYKEGHTIIKEGTSGSAFFVLLEGKARVVRRGRTIANLSPGDFFGEISLLDGGPTTASVVADTETSCLNLAGRDFRELLSSNPTLAMRVLRGLAARLRQQEQPLVG